VLTREQVPPHEDGEERRLDRGLVILALALVLVVAVVREALAGPWWVVLLALVLVPAALVAAISRLPRAAGPLRPGGPLAEVAWVVVVIGGGALVGVAGSAGWPTFAAGAMLLAGMLTVPARRVALVIAVAAVLVAAGELARPASTDELVVTALGLGVVVLGAVGRRATAERHREQRRSAHEAARAAALEERARIARDLHDVLAHTLGGLVLQLDAAQAEQRAGADPERLAARLDASRELAVGGLREARRAVQELRGEQETPSARVDLQDALAPVLDGTVAREAGLRRETVGPSPLVPDAVAREVAAAAREAVTNLAKHAPGKRAAATLVAVGGTDPGAFRLDLVNALPDGPRNGALAPTGGGFGLPGMRDRLAAVGAGLEAGVEGDEGGAPGRFVVTIRWPEERGEAS